MASPDRPDPPAAAGSPAGSRGDSDAQGGEAQLGRDSQAEIDALFALIRRRYGARLTPAELEAVRKGVQGVVEGARALRAVRLGNADEPFQPFTPFRSDS